MTTAPANPTLGNDRASRHFRGTVSAQFYCGFAAFASSLGASEQALLSIAGLREELLHDENTRVRLDRFVAMVRAAKEMTGQPGLPILFASHADFSEVSVAGLIANASPTMLDALLQLNRYGRLAVDVAFDGEASLAFRQGGDADWIIDSRRLDESQSELVEIAFTFLISGPKRFLPEPHIEQAQVKHDAPPYKDLYAEVWQCPVEFGASRNALRLPKWVATHPVGQEPSYAFGIFTAHADRILSKIESPPTLTARLQQLIILDLHTGEVSMQWAAAKLGMSRQSIYRRLKLEGTTFETLLDALRHKLALDYLSTKNVTVAEVAFLLGYADPSPFARAFKRWTGASPRAFSSRS